MTDGESKVEEGKLEEGGEEKDDYDELGPETKDGDEGEGKKEWEEEEEEEEEEDVEEVSLKMIIQPDGFPHLMSLPKHFSIEQVKQAVADDLQLQPEELVLKGARLESEPGLWHLTSGKEYSVELHIQRDVVEANTQFRLPNKLDVVVHYDDDEQPSKTITVEIVRDDLKSKKPYLGGYRNKKNGIVYHHASTQRFSDKLRKQKEQAQSQRAERFTRETQTAVLITRSAQTYRENGTQMARPDLYLDTSKDVYLTPKDYFDSTQLHALRVKSVITLQRYWRGFLARRKAHEIRSEREERIREQERREEQQAIEEKEQHDKEVQRRMNPTTVADFEVLYNELENWRQHETIRINSTPGLKEKERLKQLEELLHKETKLLQTIDRLKLTANEKNKQQRINKVLQMMASPKKWEMSDGDVTLVHTPFTTRAKELLELYEGLMASGLSVDERLDILLHVKWTVKEFDCDLTRDLVDLIDREADLLNRGRSEKAMGGLRKRISTLFLQFVETPDFNPEAARFQQVPRELIHRPQIAPKLK